MDPKTLSEIKNPLPPYISYVTFKNTIRTLGKDGLPDSIDATCLPSMAGGTQGQFLVALRSLRLIDPTGNPSPILARLGKASDADWSSVMQSIVLTTYGDLVRILKQGTMKQLRAALGDDVAGSVKEKSIRFLLAAAEDAGLTVSPAIRNARISATSRARPKGKAADSTPPPAPHDPKPKHTETSGADAWLAKYPSFDPSWAKDIQAQWFEGFAKLMALKEGKHG